MFARLIGASWFWPVVAALTGLLLAGLATTALLIYKRGQIEGENRERVATLEKQVEVMHDLIAMRDRIIEADAKRYVEDMEKARSDMASLAGLADNPAACLDADTARRLQGLGR